MSAGVGEDYFPYSLPVQSGEASLPKTEAELGEIVTSVLQGADVGVRYGRTLVSSFERIGAEEYMRRASHSLDAASFVIEQAVAQISGRNVTAAYKEGNLDAVRLDVSA